MKETYETYKGYLIIKHWGEAETAHYHWGEPDEQGRLTLPMNCTGPTTRAVREYYGPNLGGCQTMTECRAEIDSLDQAASA